MKKSGFRSWETVTALSGLLAGILGFVGFAVLATSDAFIPLDASEEDVRAAIAAAAPWQAFAGQFLEFLAQLLLLVFGVRLWYAVRRLETGTAWLSTATLLGTALWVMTAAGAIISEYAIALGANDGLTVDGAWALHFLNVAFFVGSWGFGAFFLATVSVAVVTLRIMAVWLGWIGIILAVANLVSLAAPNAESAQMAPTFLGLWLIAASIALFLRSGRETIAQSATAAV